jgi:predicted MPP superfamily phosphohydrolase
MLRPMRFHAEGRGRNYTKRRALSESLLRRIYSHGWPARVWGRVPGATRVRVIELTLPLLAEDAPEPLRLAFASDLHLGPTTPPRTLDAAFRVLTAAEPDVLLLGGDYVFLDATREKARELEARVRAVPARTKVAVLGNHDLWTRHELLEEALARAGAHVLVNDAIALDAPHGGVAIAGLDDAWTGDANVDLALSGVSGADVVIGVAHSPEGAVMLAEREVPLVFAGHTHGGHVALPGARTLFVPGAVSRAHPWGRHDIGTSTLFVSRGVGGIEVPARLFAPPDVVLATLTARGAR